ncbi:MAG: hypothetical protein ABL994_25620, partial [Verrucomicrobiales bacterium]
MSSILEWEENLFLGIKALYRRLVVSPRERNLAAVRAPLEPLRQELFLLARMVAGRSVAIVETSQAVLCDDEHLFLPSGFDAASTVEENEELFRIKTLLGALAIRSGGLSRPEISLKQLPSAWAAEFPGLRERIERLEESLADRDIWALLGESSCRSIDEAVIQSARSGELEAESAEEEIT